MKKSNHIRMGRRIFENLQKNDMPLSRRLFLFGNIAPDLTLSYVRHPHRYGDSASLIEKKLRKLCKGSAAPQGLLFSLRLGALTHYICDYFCYAHSRSFRGNLRDHIRYEKHQTPAKTPLLGTTQPSVLQQPGTMLQSASIGIEGLINSLGDRVTEWERLLEQNEADPQADMLLATDASAWVASAVYLSAKRAVELQVVVKMTRNTRNSYKMIGEIAN